MNASRTSMRGRISRLWLGLLALALGAGLYWGRDVWGLWQFKQALDREAAQVAARGPQASAWAQACVGCHGFGGASLNPAYPRLAGQPAAYLEAQLRRFASGERRNPQMEPLAASLSEAQIHALAAYFSASEAGPLPGRAMFLLPQVSSCTACHGVQLQGGSAPSGAGPVAAPRLAGQSPGYLARQLRAFRAGDRVDPSGQMQAVSRSLSDRDIDALARALAQP